MDLAWGTLVALVMLAPGFAFNAGLFSIRGISRETRPRSLPAELCFLLLSALVVHTLLRFLYLGLGMAWPLFDVNVGSAAKGAINCFVGGTGAEQFARNVGDHLTLIGTHVVLSILSGFALGALVGRPLLRGGLRGLIRHGWVYDLIPGDEDPSGVRYAYVMTKAAHEGQVQCYRGPVVQLGLTEDGTFSYVVLLAPARFFVRLLGENSTTTLPIEIGTTKGHATHAGSSVRAEYTIHIPGDSIDNIVFARVPLPTSSIEEIEALLSTLEKGQARGDGGQDEGARGGSIAPP